MTFGLAAEPEILGAIERTGRRTAVLVGLALAGRVGANIAAELGTMKVTEQVDALETLAYTILLATPAPLALFLLGRALHGAAPEPKRFVKVMGGHNVSSLAAQRTAAQLDDSLASCSRLRLALSEVLEKLSDHRVEGRRPIGGDREGGRRGGVARPGRRRLGRPSRPSGRLRGHSRCHRRYPLTL